MSKKDGTKTSIAGTCNTAVRTEGSSRAINQAAWKMPDQRYDVSAKTVWKRNSPSSKREEGKTREGKCARSLARVGLRAASSRTVELSRGFYLQFSLS